MQKISPFLWFDRNADDSKKLQQAYDQA